MVCVFNSSVKFDFFKFGLAFGQNLTETKLKNHSKSYVDNPIYQNLQTKQQIKQKVLQNSYIMNIIKKYDLPLDVNEAELQELKEKHLADTRAIVSKVYFALPNELKKEISLKDLQDAAMLHDYGKVLIPKEILNKKGKLSPEEQEIMQLHPELGYELLKDMDVNENVLNLIKFHHQNQKKSGYPVMQDKNCNLEIQILNIADKYSALTETRTYKKAFAKYDALGIIAEDVNNGLISQEVYTALAKAV